MPQSALKAILPELKKHRARLEENPILQLFVNDEDRAAQFSVEDDGFLFDYSKNRIDAAALKALLDLAHNANLADMRDLMFTGGAINFTENRAVLHTALRSTSNQPLLVDGEDIRPGIAETQKRLFAFSDAVRSGAYQLTDGAVTDVVNIGIGGSDLGPVMCVEALKPYHDGPRVHFVSNVDGADFHDTTLGLDPATTLFIIASKSFTTAETMANAQLAKDWLSATVPTDKAGNHFAALSTNLEATAKFGIGAERTFGFWNWVGGRYSIWSAIGLSLVLAIGPDRYRQFLKGAEDADAHFLNRNFENNIPVLMALIGIWHHNVCDFDTHAILPYDNRLLRFPAYLQQLDMESNGKHVCRDGRQSQVATGPVIWGEPGTNGQHAFYQLLHQGTSIVPCDFLLAAIAHEDNQTHQQTLAANCFAQSEAMMIGRDLEQVSQLLRADGLSDQEIEKLAPHKVFEGGRPSSTFLYEKLTPAILGKLIAFYEHKVFVQGVIWGINSFDQWGVELGKQLAVNIENEMKNASNDGPIQSHDGSTQRLIAKFSNFST